MSQKKGRILKQFCVDYYGSTQGEFGLPKLFILIENLPYLSST